MKSASRVLVPAALAVLLTRAALIALPAEVPVRVKALEAISDAREYEALAGNIATHRVFSRDTAPPFRPELFRTPAYPLLLAPGVAMPGGVLWWGLAVQTLLSLLMLLLVRSLARTLGLDQRPANTAALLTALSVNLAFLSTKLVTETLFATLLVIGLLLYARYLGQGRTTDLLAAGVGFGLLSLVRPIALYLPVVMAAHLLWRALRRRSAPLSPVVLLAAASLAILPWAVRNWRLAAFPGLSTAAEHNLYLYNAATVLASDKGITLAQARDSMQAMARERFGPLDSSDEAGYWTRLAAVAAEVYWQRPLRAAAVQATGFAATMLLPLGVQPLLVHCGAAGYAAAPPHVMQEALRLITAGRIGTAASVVWRGRLAILPPLALVLLALAGLHLLVLLAGVVLASLRGRLRPMAWLLLPALYFTLLPGPVGEARFRSPVEPLLCVLAAAGLAGSGARGKAGARRAQTPRAPRRSG